MSSDYYSPAFTLASRAVEADSKGDSTNAARLYEETAALFKDIIDKEVDVGRRAYIEDKRARYLERATELKGITTINNTLPVKEKTNGQLGVGGGKAAGNGTSNGTTNPELPRKTQQQPDRDQPSVSLPTTNEQVLENLTLEIESMLGKLKLTRDPTEKKRLGKLVADLLDRAERLKESADGNNENGPASPARTSLAAAAAAQPDVRAKSPVPGARPAPSPSRSPQPTFHSRSLTNRPVARSRSPQPSTTPSSSALTRQEISVLRASSRINGLLVLPWSADDPSRLPPPSNNNTHPRFLDPDGLPALSTKQKSKLPTWKRPHEWLSPPTLLPATITPQFALSIQQELVMDCTVVASLVSLAASSALHHQPLPQIIHPNVYSPHGKYLAKLFLNGIPRTLVIDDLLPFSASGDPLFTHSPGSLWVSLVEKAWIKAHGGYEYPGGGASVDLYGLTGWIPEELYFSSITDSETLWSRVFKGWKQGKVIPTVATATCDPSTGLVPNHAYAVLCLVESSNGAKMLRLKNPWGKKRWTGNYSHLDSASWTPELKRACNYEPMEASSQVDDGTFWISWTDLLLHFDSIHLNWDPSMFPHKHTSHLSWDLSGPRRDLYSLGGNPQFSLTTASEGDVWLLLSKHVVEKEENLDYITLLVYAGTEGERVYYPGGAMVEGVYINSPHVLVRFTAPKEPAKYTLVVSQHEKRRSLSFTVRAFSIPPLVFAEIPKGYPHEHRTTGSWTEGSAGGCMSHPSFYTNPQYKISVSSSGNGGKLPQVFLMIEAPRTFPVNVKLVKGGNRVSSAAQDAVVLGSGDYRHGFAFARGQLEPGSYVAVISTFEPDLLGDFFLTVGSTAAFTVSPVEAEGEGMKETRVQGEWIEGKSAVGCVHFRMYENNPAVLFELSRPSRVRIRLMAPSLDPVPALNVAVFRSFDVDGRATGDEVLGSGPYSNWLQGVVTPARTLAAGRYAAVVSTWEPKAGRFMVVFYCEDEDVVPVLRQG